MNMENIDISCSSEWHIAQSFHRIFPNEFQYVGKKKWNYWDETSHTWKEDVRKERLQNKIKVDFCSYARERATFWQQQILENNTIDKHTATHTIIRILMMTQKLQTLPFLRKVIRELQEFYETSSPMT